ncbi:cysteine-rich protein 2-like isoform X1 [Plectropomus leopardus]|uniref:cysteine-rich protein 2-like isoform X1 n=1 Tax=Plectropomus leopardus TaxID=160734 RepID=UPI001C4D7627|nr:cysteine-rich protein 2-like isoform X1 [Plectropomus leopardus]
MASKCPKCDKTVYFAEKVSSLGKDWHKFCLKCERCNKTLNPGGHAEHDGTPYCHKPCYATLFGPKGVNIGGAGSYVYDAPVNEAPAAVSMETDAKPEEEKKAHARGPVKAASFSSFSGGPNICPRCNKTVYFAEKVSSLGKNWHRPCLRCERCSKTLAPGSHAEHDGQPYCHKPCYAVLFGPKGMKAETLGSSRLVSRETHISSFYTEITQQGRSKVSTLYHLFHFLHRTKQQQHHDALVCHFR